MNETRLKVAFGQKLTAAVHLRMTATGFSGQSADLMGLRDRPEVPISACSSRLKINPQRTLQVQASVTDSE